jgi:AGCS family alanine or glycine:cation symporter
MQQIDEAFGRYIVAPLSTVLFFDFGSGQLVERLTGTRASIPLVVAWLLAGAVICTIYMKFINVRGFWHAIRVTTGAYDDPSKPGEVSHFQALSSALSGTVGLGNIAGVAIAVCTGGPGTVFWLIVAGLLGMSSKFVECTLGQMYRKVAPDGTISGGPMHYLADGLAELGLPRFGKVLAAVFAVMCIGGALGGGCVFQVKQSIGAIQREIPLLYDYPWLYGLFLAVITGVVIVGGIRRIASTADKVVPFMCALYVFASLYILGARYEEIPAAFQQIIDGAFTPSALYGGFIGVMVIGIQRAAFSNEAGMGSASIAHSAAKTSRPVSEGMVSLLEPFIDTVVICTMTGLVIVITGAFDRDSATYGPLINNPGGIDGAAITSLAFGGEVDWFRYVLCLSVFLFAYATMIAWSYYGERCATQLFGPRASLPFKLIFLGFVVLGSIISARHVLDFSDLMILSMGFPNLLGLFLLCPKVKRALDEYWRDYQTGALDREAGR